MLSLSLTVVYKLILLIKLITIRRNICGLILLVVHLNWIILTKCLHKFLLLYITLRRFFWRLVVFFHLITVDIEIKRPHLIFYHLVHFSLLFLKWIDYIPVFFFLFIIFRPPSSIFLRWSNRLLGLRRRSLLLLVRFLLCFRNRFKFGRRETKLLDVAIIEVEISVLFEIAYGLLHHCFDLLQACLKFRKFFFLFHLLFIRLLYWFLATATFLWMLVI